VILSRFASIPIAFWSQRLASLLCRTPYGVLYHPCIREVFLFLLTCLHLQVLIRTKQVFLIRTKQVCFLSMSDMYHCWEVYHHICWNIYMLLTHQVSCLKVVQVYMNYHMTVSRNSIHWLQGPGLCWKALLVPSVHAYISCIESQDHKHAFFSIQV